MIVCSKLIEILEKKLIQEANFMNNCQLRALGLLSVKLMLLVSQLWPQNQFETRGIVFLSANSALSECDDVFDN